jgi:pheromone shutdown-related protein TraB
MKTFKNISIIGTSHISPESIKEVTQTIKKLKPDIIAIELDKKRYSSLLSKKRKIKFSDIKALGVKGFLFNLIGAWVEKKLGKYTGVEPGSEMKTAIKLAKKTKAKIALIDQDIEITIRKLMKAITWKEKFTFIKDLFASLFFGKKKIEFDLKKVPSQKLINKMLKEVKKSYPSFYNVLVKDRNKVLSKNLYNLSTLYPKKKILAIIGAGHEKQVLGELKSIKKSKL